MQYAGEKIWAQANANNNANVFGPIMINVKSYGAKGNGSTDDTSAVQTAINTAYDNGGGIVFFPTPEESYYIAGTIVPKSGVSLIGAAMGIPGATMGAYLKGNGTNTIIKYDGVFGSEAYLGCEISHLTFSDCKIGIHLRGVSDIHVHHCTFMYIRGGVDYAGLVLENCITSFFEFNFFFYNATAIRLDKGINYHLVMTNNEIIIDDCFGLGTNYRTSGIMVRCDSTNTGFGPLTISRNNFINAGNVDTNLLTMYGVHISARGTALTMQGNTFEAIPHFPVITTPTDPITEADHMGDGAGMYIYSGEISGNHFTDNCSGGAGNRQIQLEVGTGIRIEHNYFKPQTAATGTQLYLGTYAYKNVVGFNTVASSFVGTFVEEINSNFGRNLVMELTFIDAATDGPAMWEIKQSTIFRLEAADEYSGKLSNFTAAQKYALWTSSVSQRLMMVHHDGTAAVQTRIPIQSPPRYLSMTSTTLTLLGSDSTIQVVPAGNNLVNINTAFYDGQEINIIAYSAPVTVKATGNINPRGGGDLVLAVLDGAKFVWSSISSKWSQV